MAWLRSLAFSIILGWCYYGESAVNYIEHQRINRFYRILYIVALFFGSIINLDVIWNIADTMNALMAIPNLVALLLLSGGAARETKKHLWGGHLYSFILLQMGRGMRRQRKVSMR